MMYETLEDFYSYVLSFYGEGAIYPMKATKDMVMEATQKYINSGADFCGDSIDREHIRDIMMRDYGLKMPTNKQRRASWRTVH
jgi:hypothetical protein